MSEIYFTDTYGQRRKGVAKNCIVCNKSFVSRVDQPHKTCSQQCAGISRQNRLSFTCAWCHQEFKRKACSVLGSKSKLYFCTRTCKDAAQKLGGIVEIMPSHYGTADGIYSYRDLFVTEELYCRRCGYKEFLPAIHIHHIDRNRRNNKKENLIPLCANCHIALHNGLWVLENIIVALV